jgi:hypothetical protein
MTVYVAGAHAHVQRLVSVDKMATVLEECTIEEHISVLRFICGKKDSMQRVFITKISCLRWEVSVAQSGSHMGREILSWTFEIRRWCPTRWGRGWDNSQKTSMLRVSTHWQSDGTSVSMFVEDMSWNACSFSGSNISYFTINIHLWPTYWISLLYWIYHKINKGTANKSIEILN